MEHTELPWSQGRLLKTKTTEKWTAEEKQKVDALEGKEVFANFSVLDEGKSRKRVAVCETEEDAKFITTACNSYYKLLEACRKAEKDFAAINDVAIEPDKVHCLCERAAFSVRRAIDAAEGEVIWQRC
jgi:hypothetical protein